MEWGEENSMTCKQEMIDWYGWVLAFKLEFFQVLHASPHLTKNFQLKAFGSLMGLNESEYLGQNTELARDEMLYEMQMKTIKTINIWATLNYSEGQSTTWYGQNPTNLPKFIIKSSKIKRGRGLTGKWPGAQGVIWKYGNHGLEGLESGRFSLTISIIIHI